MTDIRNAARTYAQAGYALAAWDRRLGKGPTALGWGLQAVEPEAVHDDHNIGLNHALSRTAVLDVDDLVTARKVLEAFDVDVDALAVTTMTWAGNPENRMKLAFRCEAGLSNKKLIIERAGKKKTVFELRGAPEGKQSQDVLPPSIHPDTRKPYQFITQLVPRDQLPELPDPLAQLWRNWRQVEAAMKMLAGCEATKPRSQLIPRSAPSDRPDVIGTFNARYTAVEIIERNGYVRVGKRWRHPDSTTGVAGVIQFDDGCLYAHGGGALADDKPHDAFDCYRILEHGGDVRSAVRAAAELLGLRAQPANPSIEGVSETDGEAPEPDVPLFITGADLRRQAFEPKPPIIEEVLLVGATLLHGPAKKGKSWLLLQMADAIDSGVEFLGKKASRREVFYLGAEDTSERFKSRLERIGAGGSTKFMNRDALKVFSERLRRSLGEAPVTVEVALTKLWEASGRPSVVIIDTQEVFETMLGISHGRAGDSVTRRDYLATSTYDGWAQAHGVAVVLVGHWGEIKSIAKATINPHECINTTKARINGVLTSITLGPLPNQEPGESTRDMQLSIRSRDLPGGDQFLWVRQDEFSGRYEYVGKVQDVLATEAQARLFEALEDVRKEHGKEHWSLAADLAEHLGCSVQAVKQMVGRVRKAAKAAGRKAMHRGWELESKPNKGYRLV